MKFSTPETEEVSINLTPLIDIVFLLLIYTGIFEDLVLMLKILEMKPRERATTESQFSHSQNGSIFQQTLDSLIKNEKRSFVKDQIQNINSKVKEF